MAELEEYNNYCLLFNFDDESDNDLVHVHEHDSVDEEIERNQALDDEKDSYSEHKD